MQLSIVLQRTKNKANHKAARHHTSCWVFGGKCNRLGFLFWFFVFWWIGLRETRSEYGGLGGKLRFFYVFGLSYGEFLWEGLWCRKQVESDFTELLKGVYKCAIGNFGVPQCGKTMEEGDLSLDERGDLTFNFHLRCR